MGKREHATPIECGATVYWTFQGHDHTLSLMSSNPSRPASPSTSTSNRIVDLLFGLFLAAVAVAILIWSEPSTLAGSIVAALIIGGLGIESIYSAKRGRRSLVARIGPLP